MTYHEAGSIASGQPGILARLRRAHRSLSLLLISLLPLQSLPLQATELPAPQFGSPGLFEVSPRGAATYQIPIQVPPGTAGIVPELSIGYDSQAGNGPLGLGWRLNGLSQITRCPATIAQDGARGGINYDANDKYCLDGQRLIAVSGTYGGNGTQYHTELASFAKIISYGSAGNGPAWFKVWTKAGRILEYGNTADSRVEAQGKSSAKQWNLNKLSDRKGNYLTATYTEDTPNGETVVNRIDYTGNASSSPAVTPYASLQFTYATRPDATTGYQAGSIYKQTKRLTSIKTYHGATVVKDYRLTYLSTGVYHTNTAGQSDGSLLSQVQECDGSATPVCLAPTTFAWSGQVPGFATPTMWFPSAIAWDGGGDFNGDGRYDIMGNSSSWDPRRQALISTGSSFLHDGSWGVSSLNVYKSYMDMNGDGITDAVFGNSAQSGIEVGLSDGSSGFAASSVWFPAVSISTLPSNSDHWVNRYADLNGDGRPDFIYKNNNNQYLASLSTGTGFLSPANWVTLQYNSVPNFVDVNGDGMADMVYRYNSSIYVGLSTGTGFAIPTVWVPYSLSRYTVGESYVDVNGDGLADAVMMVSEGEFHLALSTGLVFTGFTQALQHPLVVEYKLLDMNNDGLMDLVYRDANNNIWVAYSNGSTFNAPINILPGISINLDYLVDLNGDGFPDYFSGNASNIQVSLSTGESARVISITDGQGVVHGISYKPLADQTVHTRDSGANASSYPIQDKVPSLYVVSSTTSSDGVGGSLPIHYTYGGAKTDVSGRGFLGFRWIKTSYPDHGHSFTTYYHQAYPLTGLAWQIEKRNTANILLSATSINYANSALTDYGQFPHMEQSINKSWELDGTLATSVSTTNQYDSYGNLTQIAEEDGEGYLKTTDTTYRNDTTNWILGKPIRQAVTSNAVNQATVPPQPAIISIVPLSADKAEGDYGDTTAFTFTVSRTSTAGTTNIAWSVSGHGTSPANTSDFTGNTFPSGVISILPGQASAVLTVNIQGDLQVEPHEAFQVTLSNPVTHGSPINPVIGTATATGTIRDDEPAGTYLFAPVISADTQNYNLKAAAIAAGWNQTAPLSILLTLNSGTWIGSSSTATPALDTGSGFPANSRLVIVNHGNIVGAGGNGGNGQNRAGTVAATPGQPGGLAFKAQAPVQVYNHGVIGGGGGGHGGSGRQGYEYCNNFYEGDCIQYATIITSGGPGGTGGAGYAGGAGGTGGAGNPSGPGGNGSAGGRGPAGLGVNGSTPYYESEFSLAAPGGAGGAATSGGSNITWKVTGTRAGALN